MAHEILSAKLCELDQKTGRLHSRIQLSETGSWEEIQREVAAGFGQLPGVPVPLTKLWRS